MTKGQLIWLIVSAVISLQTPVLASNFYLITDDGTSARTIGLGGIGSFSRSADVIFENPAGIKRTATQHSVSVFTTTMMNEVNYNNIAITTETPIGRLGFGYMEAAISGIPSTALSGGIIVTSASYNYRNYIAKLAYAVSLNDNIALGASLVNYGISFSDVSGTGTNVDFGGIFDYGNLGVSLVVMQALDTKIRYADGAREDLLPRYILATQYRFASVDVLGQAKVQGNKTLLAAALSYRPDFAPYLEGNIGHKEILVLDKIKRNITLGVGLLLDGFNLYYAYEKSDHPLFNNKNYFSISINL